MASSTRSTRALEASAAGSGGAGDVAWVNPGNARTWSNATWARVTLNAGQTSEGLRLTAFGFGDFIRSTETISGVEVYVWRRAGDGDVFDKVNKFLVGGAAHGDDWADTVPEWSTPGWEIVKYGGPHNLLTATLATATVRAADFGLFLRTDVPITPGGVAVDIAAIRVRVHTAGRFVDLTGGLSGRLWGHPGVRLVPGLSASPQ
ncbi:hypothetical protein LCGC14_2440740 [marine sediment metagenome]|uniref:Uncharacterized protein n=1 Tax=marine sediment metagenome TaxID=412755 RepID=A0A0F9ED10_9ZZZZ